MFSVVPWVPLLVLLIAMWRIAAAARGWKLPSLWLRVPVTLLGFIGVALSYRSVSGVEAGSALLLVMAGMKLLETRNERDRVLVVLIGYFLLFAVFLREQAIWSLAWLAGGVDRHHRRAGPDRAPGTAALAAGHRRACRRGSRCRHCPWPLVLFLLFPRIPGPFWAMPTAETDRPERTRR